MLFFGSVLLGLVVVATVPRLLSVFIKPSAVYPLFGFRDRIHRAIVRMTGVRFFTHLFGDSSYITAYLRWLGYDLGEVVQTGSNFGTDVGQDTRMSHRQRDDGRRRPGDHELRRLGHVVPRLAGVHRGDSFFGNNIDYPAGGRVGNNCLIATKAMIPLDGKVREGVGLLVLASSPSRPAPVRISPSSGIIALVAIRQLLPTRRLPGRDVIPEEAVPPDVNRRDAERRGRDVGVHDRQAVGDHRTAADDAHVRGILADVGAEVESGLHDFGPGRTPASAGRR